MRTSSTFLSLSLLHQVATGFAPKLVGARRESRWSILGEQSDEADTSAPSPPKLQPDILLPFSPAADATYMCTGPVGENDFCVTRTGPPIVETELTNENILKIVKIDCTDLEVNTLVWKCFGYRFNPEASSWDATECFPKWREKYPEPPDFIGMQRRYEPEIDKPCRKANQALVRSIPADNKQSLKEYMRPLGWKGYQYAELTPNKTRRAQCANWLIYYREELHGYSIEELRERRRQKQISQEAAEAAAKEKDEWKPPVKEVF